MRAGRFVSLILAAGLIGIAPAGLPAGPEGWIAADQAAQTPEDRARAFIDRLAAGDFAAAFAAFDQTMTSALPEVQLRASWVSLVAQSGAFGRQLESRVERRGPYQAVIVTCQFERAQIDVTVVYDTAGRVAGLSMRPAAMPYSPPPYATPGAYTERDVVVGARDWPLPGTLTRPAAEEPAPAVVLVHGSGPNDRDETVGANRPFKDLALGLASRGVAVLRYEKRTRAHAARTGTIARFTVKDETIDDALAAVQWLRTAPGIDARRIVVAGHSLGGTLVPRIAQADPAIAGFVILAGAVRPIEDAIVAQVTYIARADGTVTEAEQRQIDEMVALGARVRALTAGDAANPAPIFGAPASYWLDLRGYDPPAVARTLTVPLLVLQGERDYQVTMVDDFTKWQAALAGTPTATLKSYPALNHLFIAGSGPSLPAEYLRAGYVDEAVIRDIAAWVQALPAK